MTLVQTHTVTRTTTATITRTTAPEPAVYVPESGGRLLYRPRTIVTGVSGGVIYFDRWLSYGGDAAKARARFEVNDCSPNCAQGKISYVKAVVVLSPIVPCRGTPIYESLSVISSDDESYVGQSSDLVGLCHEGSGPP